MNASDLPPEDLPAGITPMTVPEMIGHVRATFEQNGCDGGEASLRAELALAHLLKSSYLSLWGMTEHGEPTYIPTVPKVRAVLIVKGK